MRNLFQISLTCSNYSAEEIKSLLKRVLPLEQKSLDSISVVLLESTEEESDKPKEPIKCELNVARNFIMKGDGNVNDEIPAYHGEGGIDYMGNKLGKDGEIIEYHPKNRQFENGNRN